MSLFLSGLKTTTNIGSLRLSDSNRLPMKRTLAYGNIELDTQQPITMLIPRRTVKTRYDEICLLRGTRKSEH